jgi:hypothetical protein
MYVHLIGVVMKTKRFEIRMTEVEFDVLASKAKREGMSMSSYVRDLIGFKTVVRPMGRPSAGYDPESDDPRRSSISKRTTQKFDGDAAGVAKRMGDGMIPKMKPGFGTDAFGNKVSLAKPCKKK